MQIRHSTRPTVNSAGRTRTMTVAVLHIHQPWWMTMMSALTGWILMPSEVTMMTMALAPHSELVTRSLFFFLFF